MECDARMVVSDFLRQVTPPDLHTPDKSDAVHCQPEYNFYRNRSDNDDMSSGPGHRDGICRKSLPCRTTDNLVNVIIISKNVTTPKNILTPNAAWLCPAASAHTVSLTEKGENPPAHKSPTVPFTWYGQYLRRLTMVTLEIKTIFGRQQSSRHAPLVQGTPQ